MSREGAPGKNSGESTNASAELDEIKRLEVQVHLAELRAREVEAENRYLKACAERRDLKGVRKDEQSAANRALGKSAPNKASRKAAAKAARKAARRQKKAKAGSTDPKRNVEAGSESVGGS